MNYRTNPDGSRVPDVCCALCRAKADGMVQLRDARGQYPGDDVALRTLAASGWLEHGGNWYCGKFCKDRHAYANARRADAMKAVTTSIVPPGPRPPAPPAAAARR